MTRAWDRQADLVGSMLKEAPNKAALFIHSRVQLSRKEAVGKGVR